jgi:YfiH family protein
LQTAFFCSLPGGAQARIVAANPQRRLPIVLSAKAVILRPEHSPMKRDLINGLYLWRFENLSLQSRVRHFVTDRNTGGTEFTLSLSSTPDKEKVRIHRRELASSLGIGDDALYFPSQVHGTRIVQVTAETDRNTLKDADALICRDTGLCIAVMSADCVPVLLYDKRNHAVGAVHSGWRGTVAKILEKTLSQMKTSFGTEGRDVVAGIGPSVSQDSYEVGEEVITEVNRSFGPAHDLLLAQPSNKARLDLWKANRVQLLEFGVPAANIEVSDLCTVKNNNYFFSARKGDSGRFAAGIMIL